MSELTLQDFKNKICSYTDEIYSVPKDLVVEEGYLNGLTREEFVQPFEKYRDIIAQMYQGAAQQPYNYGFTSVNKQTGEEKLYGDFSNSITYLDKLLQVQHFINRICDVSELSEDTLIVDTAKFKKLLDIFPKIKSPDILIQRLIDFGFVFTGYSGKLSATNKCISRIKMIVKS